MAGISENRPVSQGPWSPLHASLVPAHHVGCVHKSCHLVQEILACQSLVHRPMGIQRLADLVLVVPGTQVRAVHSGLARLAQEAIPEEIGCPHGATCIASSWMNPQVFDRAGGKNGPIGHTVERHAP